MISTKQMVADFNAETDTINEAVLARVAEEFGDHPIHWPVPPRVVPRWWQFKRARQWREACAAFGNLSQADLDAFWAEARKGQSVYEDAGGSMSRCYRAMLALPTEAPYTYNDALSDLLREPRP